MPNTAESKVIISKPVTVNGIKFRVSKQDHHVVNMEALVNDRQYHRLLTKFDDKLHRWSNACYTYLFQSELAAFEQKCIDHPQYKTKDKGIEDLTKTLRRWSEA